QHQAVSGSRMVEAGVESLGSLIHSPLSEIVNSCLYFNTTMILCFSDLPLQAETLLPR
ncbi:unnamed protein product, partial [Bubo scandiacus]